MEKIETLISLHSKSNLPVVTAIIERQHEGKTQVLVQTRWKPDRDPVYSGTTEMPAGVMNEYECVYNTLEREVLKETGLKVTLIKSHDRTKVYRTGKDDASFGFMPFCCHQQLRNGRPWIGFAFLCEVEDKEPTPQEGESKDTRWIDKQDLRKIFRSTPDKIFALQLGVLEYYFEAD